MYPFYSLWTSKFGVAIAVSYNINNNNNKETNKQTSLNP